MLKSWLNRIITTTALAIAFVIPASANITMDLDLQEGDQGLKTKQVQPGEVIEIQLIAQQGAMDIAGFEVVVKYDAQQFAFSSYQKGGLMASAISLPASQTSDGIKISAGFLGGTSTQDSGTLGTLVFEATSQLTTGGSIVLTQGSFGSAGRTEQFALNSEIALQGPNAGTTTQSSQTQQGDMNNPGMDLNGDGVIDQLDAQIHQQQMQQGGGQGFGQGQNPFGGNMGMGHGQNPPDPMQLIQQLPANLQNIYLATHRTHLNNKLEDLNSIRQTLEQTRQALASAMPQERNAIGRVLLHFYHEFQDGPPQGGPPPSDPNTLLNVVMQNVDQKIQKIQQELGSIR